MPRLIDADALYQSFGASGNCNNCPLDAYKCQYYNEHTLMEFCERIDDAPTIDAEPVRHGHWEEKNVAFDDKAEMIQEWQSAKCSVCGLYDTIPYLYYPVWSNYCPNCGAKMDEEEK